MKRNRPRRVITVLVYGLILSLLVTACQVFPSRPSEKSPDPTTIPLVSTAPGSPATTPGLAASAGDGTTVAPTEPVTTPTTSRATLPEMTAQQVFDQYRQAWERFDFAAMYATFSTAARAKYDQEAFVTRLNTIFTAMEARNLKVVDIDSSASSVSADGRSIFAFGMTMDTKIGPVKVEHYKMALLREVVDDRTVFGVEWNERLLFPNMGEDDKIRINTVPASRGEIVDRNGQPLALNGELVEIGLVPRKFNTVKATAVPQIAQLLDIPVEDVQRLADSATNADWFYPVARLYSDENEKINQLLAIDGIQGRRVKGRVYPGGEAFGNLVGYVRPITAEQLTKLAVDGYKSTDIIGIWGIEQAYEKRLRGTDGGEIVMTVGDSSEVRMTIARQDPVNGENIRLTIDAKMQNAIYEEMRKTPTDAGHSAAINPQTGEILALVSAPSFDAKYTQTYKTTAIRNLWDKNTGKKIFLIRANAGYAPGSTFKVVTSAAGLKNNTLNPTELIDIQGLKWQPSPTWKEVFITRVKDPKRPVNFYDAILFSDNIYFAMQALRLGKTKFEQAAAEFGIGERLPLDFPTYKSQLSNAGLVRDGLVADTGYGQGEILVTSLHMAMFFGALTTGGNIMAPRMDLKSGSEPSVWKANAIMPAHVQMLVNAFMAVPNDPAGSAYKPESRVRIFGKTGTAELAKSIADLEAEENGWFIGVNADKQDLVIAMMIEDVKQRNGSRYVVPKVKTLFDALVP